MQEIPFPYRGKSYWAEKFFLSSVTYLPVLTNKTNPETDMGMKRTQDILH